MTALQRLAWLAKQARDENQASSKTGNGTAFKIPPHKSYSIADTVKRLSLAPYGAASPGIKGPGGTGTLNPNTQPEFVAGQAKPVFYPNVPPGASKPYYVPPIKPIRKEEMADILRLAD